MCGTASVKRFQRPAALLPVVLRTPTKGHWKGKKMESAILQGYIGIVSCRGLGFRVFCP